MHLHTLLSPKKIDLPRVAEVLDELGHRARLDTVLRWDKETQAALFEAAKGFRPIELDHFVPSSVGSLVEVIHHGKNTLPAFSHFQKRFCKPKDPEANPGLLWGYNHQSTGWFNGPGFYVATKGETEGEVDIDYRRVPPEKPDGWPAIRPNDASFGARVVYGGMVDVMRGISNHVSIGRARKSRGWMNAWFVLCREDVS